MDRAPRHSAMVDFHQHCERRWVVLEEDHEKVEKERDQLRAEIEALRKDAERYRTLRALHWFDGPFAVVRDPKTQVKPGTYCPSEENLDAAIDALMAPAAEEVKP